MCLPGESKVDKEDRVGKVGKEDKEDKVGKVGKVDRVEEEGNRALPCESRSARRGSPPTAEKTRQTLFFPGMSLPAP